MSDEVKQAAERLREYQLVCDSAQEWLQREPDSVLARVNWRSTEKHRIELLMELGEAYLATVAADGLSYDDALRIAKGCFDYGGGHRGAELEIFHHGIQTVVNALEGAKRSRLSDLQSQVLHSIGSEQPSGQETQS